MTLSGICKDRDLVEIVEIQDHPWFIGVQFHPEFKSKPLDPHPLFTHFIHASLDQASTSTPKAKVVKPARSRKQKSREAAVRV